MTVLAPEFFGPIVKECTEEVADRAERSEMLEEYGHSLALEKPERLAKLLKEFVLDRKGWIADDASSCLDKAP
jgi:hypothetical protein